MKRYIEWADSRPLKKCAYGQWVHYDDVLDLFDPEDLQLAINLLESHHEYTDSETNAYGNAARTLKKMLKEVQG